MLRGTSIARWSSENGYSKQLVHSVLHGRIGKLQSPVTKSGQIKAALVRDGFWPPEDLG